MSRDTLTNPSLPLVPFDDTFWYLPPECHVLFEWSLICFALRFKKSGFLDCPVICPDVNDPKCGTDDVTYHNDCEMLKKNCENPETKVEIKHDGEC
jgi:hypothetical protein